MSQSPTSARGVETVLDERRAVLLLAATALLLRVVVRLTDGEANYVVNGYQLYREIAQTLLDGGGLCYEPGIRCAVRMPLYPLVVSALLAFRSLYPGLVILQAALGASLVWIASKLGGALFGRRTALLAAAATAFNPYAVVHDTAIQETVLANLLVASAVWLLIRPRPAGSTVVDVLAGLSMALAVLTTARVAFIVPCGVLWVLFSSGPWRSTVRRAALVAIPTVLLVGGWTVRNWTIVGVPVLTTESGESLWKGNNAWTFQFLPDRSIDFAMAQSVESLSESDQKALDALDGRDVERDALMARWAWKYVATHPWEVAVRASRKIWMPVSGKLSPARGELVSLAYLAMFAPIHGLALLGLWRVRRQKGEHLLVVLLIAGFLLTTAVYWAHTSHKSVVDVLLFVYAASVLAARGLQRPPV